MAAITQQKYEEKTRIGAALRAIVEKRNAAELRITVLALAEGYASKMNLQELREWRELLERTQKEGG